MAKIIVTGGAGFIGSNLVRTLNARGENDILVVDHLNHDGKRRNLEELAFADFMDKTTFRHHLGSGEIAPPETLFHLGACSSTTETDEDYLKDNNTAYTEQLCRWALATGTRFIYASSAATYGDGRHGYSDADDRTKILEPLNLYGISKQAFDLLALREGWYDRIVGLKYFNVFGPGEDHKGDMRSVVHKAFRQVCSTGEIRLFRSHRPEFRDGEQTRDFVFVEDAVAVTLFFHDQTERGGLFNCGTGRARTWLDLAHAVFRALDREPRIVFEDMPATLRERYQYHTQAEIDRLRSAGCDHPFASLEQGVEKTIRSLCKARQS